MSCGNGRSDYLLRWLNTEASTPISSGETAAGDEDDQSFADRLYRLCLHALQYSCQRERDKCSSSARSTLLREHLGRFYLWGERFGAGELDGALDQSDDLRVNVLERLGHFGKLVLRDKTYGQILLDFTEYSTAYTSLLELAPLPISSEGTIYPFRETQELKSIVRQTRLIVSGNSNEVLESGVSSGEESGSGAEDLSDAASYDSCEEVGFTTACLIELGPSLEQSLACAEKFRFRSVRPPPVSFGMSGPAKYYVSLVREKYQQAPDQLVERLGEANWQRHMRVRKRVENTTSTVDADLGPTCSVFRPFSAFHDSGIGTTVPPQSIQSHASFISSNTEGDQDSLRVPPMPTEVDTGKPFRCHLCGQFLNIKSRISWKIHVFADLQPYICTFADCEYFLAQFPSRNAWADHEFAKHRIHRTWKCPECHLKCTSAVDWEDHLRRSHQRDLSGPKLHVALSMAQDIQPRAVEKEECPLCRVVLQKPRRAFIKHVGQHMEEIALMALPRDFEADSDEVSTSTGSTSLRSKNSKMLATMTGPESHKTNELYVDGYEFLENTSNQQLVSKEDSSDTSPHIGQAAQSYAGTQERLNSPGPEEGAHRSWARRRKSELAPTRDVDRRSDRDKEFKLPRDLTKHQKTHSRPENTSTLGTVDNQLYETQDKTKEGGEKLLMRALAGYEKAKHPLHTLTLCKVSNLGVFFHTQDRVAEAENMYTQVLAGYEKFWGPEHPLTGNIFNSLGNVFGAQGRIKGAEGMYKRPLAGKEEGWIGEHTSVLNIVNNLGAVYMAQGRLKEAEDMFMRASAGYQKIWGPGHASTLDSSKRLGDLYRAQGRQKKPKQCFCAPAG